MAAATAAEIAAAAARAKKLNLEKATNFMRQYRDPQSRELKKLSANQFMEVWSHYDKDGEYLKTQSLFSDFLLQPVPIHSANCVRNVYSSGPQINTAELECLVT
jgi:hypothetical protein